MGNRNIPQATGTFHKLPEPSTSYRNIPQANGTFHKRPEQSTSYRKIPRATATFKFCFSKFIFGTRFSNDVFQTLFFKNRCSKHVFSTFVSNTVLKKNRTQFAEIWILVFKMCPWHHDTQEVHVLFFLLRFAIPAEAICPGRPMAASRKFGKVGEVIFPHFRFFVVRWEFGRIPIKERTNTLLLVSG